MAIDVSFRDGYSTSAQDLSRFNKNFLINEGVANDGLKVSQSTVPAMSVQVTAGTSYFYGTGTTADTMFEFYSDSTETVTIPTASVQDRIDIVCCKVDASTGVASLVVVSGTPSGSPAVPATPASHYKLANVSVGAGVTTITDANITDTRRTMFMVPTGARNQGLINGKIVPTVASNNLTVAIKTLQDTDPSTTNPVFVWIGGVLRPITSALSCSANAGFNLFNSGSAELATREIDYFVYIGNRTSDNTLFLGFSRIPYAKVITDFSDTANNEKYVRFGDGSFNPSAVIGAITNIGRFAATLSASASHNWSVPTFTNVNLIQEPIYETRWFSPDPVVVGFSGTPTKNMKCRLQMNTLQISFDVSGASNATNFTVTSPFIFNNPSACNNARPGYSEDNGVALAASRVDFVNGTRVMNIFSSGGAGGWTASGSKRAMAQFFVEI